MKNMNINIHEPVLQGNEKKYLMDCVNEGWVSSSGKYINLFENKIKNFTKSKYVICLNSGTSALHLSLKSLNIKKNEEVIISSLTFVSPINSILYNNSIPVFMDCDKYCNIDIDKTISFIKNETHTKIIKNKKITFNKKTKRKIAAIIVVHIFGNSANISELIKICKNKNIKIIEDAAESFGSYHINNKKIKHLGTIGDVGCISFNGNKIITSGGGGAIVTNNKKIYETVKHISNQSKTDVNYFKHDQVGYNYRITNLQSAIGLAQIEKINKFIKLKKIINRAYKSNFNNFDNYKIMDVPKYSISNNWINILEVNNKKINIKKIFNVFRENKIQTRSVWYPNHLHPYLKEFQTYKIENAYYLFKKMICLPSSSNLTTVQVNKISNLIKNIS